MLECPKDPTLQPGTWNLWTTGKRKVLFSCPRCNLVALLAHEIAPDGSVSPSVQCPKEGCFHDTIRLMGWVEEISEDKEE